MQSVDWALYTDKEGEINSPEFIKLVSDFSDWLRDQPEVDNVRTISDTYKKLNMNMHDDDPEWYKIPESREMKSVVSEKYSVATSLTSLCVAR